MKRIKWIVGKFVLLCVCMMIPCMMDSSQVSKAASYSLAQLSANINMALHPEDTVGDGNTRIVINPGVIALVSPSISPVTINLYAMPTESNLFQYFLLNPGAGPLGGLLFRGYRVISVDVSRNTVTVEPYFDDNPSASGGFGGCEITISTDTSGYTYDGTPKRPSVSARQGSKVLSEDTDYKLYYFNNINAGTNTASVVVLGIGEYSGGIRTLGFSIDPKTVNLSWSTTTSFVYDGNEHCPTATATDLIIGDSCNVTVTGGQTNASNSTYTATASSLSNSNYKLPSEKTKSFTISQREVGLTWGSNSFTYDGQTHCPSATATNLITRDSCNVTVAGGQTNASDSAYTATASSLSNPNYKLPSVKTRSFTISKRPLTITAAAQTVICDGTIDTGTDKVSAPNLVSGHRVTSITLTPSDVSSPTTTGTITPSSAVIKDAGENTVTSNYNITYANGTLNVINCTHTHLTAHPEEQPTLISTGHVAYWTCDDCGKKFSDSLGTNEINTVPALYKVVYSANGGSGTMADSVAQIGDRLTLPACGFGAPANKEFDHWEVSGLDQICAPTQQIEVVSNICVGSVITVTARWRAAAVPYKPPSYSTPTYTPPSYSTPTDPPAPEPKFGKYSGWSDIAKAIADIPAGGTLTIDMNGTMTLPSTAIGAIKGKDVNLVLDMGKGIKWTINGMSVTDSSKNIYMGVYLGTSGIPVDVINNLTGERKSMTMMLSHDGQYGFKAILTLPLDTNWSGLIANLFYFNKATQLTEFIASGEIRPDGSADLEVSHASDYVIVIDDHSLDPSIVPEPEPEVLTLKATSKKGKVTLSWNKLTGAKKYRIYQKIGKSYKMLTELKKKKFTVKKAYKKVKVKIKKKEKTTLELKKLTAGKEYTFVVKALVDGKWTKVTEQATKKVKVKK